MSNNSEANYKNRMLARVIVEAKTPIAVGSGQKDILTDSLVLTDVNGLPYLPGTSIAGVVRHSMAERCEEEVMSNLWGFQKAKDGAGSRLIISDARILNSKGEVCDGLVLRDEIEKDDLLRHYEELPIRQHVRIGSQGTAETAGKFDQQVVFCGTRFCFEIELLCKQPEPEAWQKVLDTICGDGFRIGGGTRNGFGELEVKELRQQTLDLGDAEQMEKYARKSSNLRESAEWWDDIAPAPKRDVDHRTWNRYDLCLQPADLFMFGSGMGDDEGDADMTAVTESKVFWNGDGKQGSMVERQVVIPATSVKGALSHRVAYYYNKSHRLFAGDPEAKTGDENPAVKALFGCGTNGGSIMRGNVIFSDIIQGTAKEKILNHVSIDRFTGGAIEGALFAEKPLWGDQQYALKILVSDAVDEESVECLEMALRDVCNGLLPLGGGVNRGHGVFRCTDAKKNGEPFQIER